MLLKEKVRQTTEDVRRAGLWESTKKKHLCLKMKWVEVNSGGFQIPDCMIDEYPTNCQRDKLF